MNRKNCRSGWVIKFSTSPDYKEKPIQLKMHEWFCRHFSKEDKQTVQQLLKKDDLFSLGKGKSKLWVQDGYSLK